MKKITIMGIAVGAVLTIGIFANIGLFGNNALAAEPTMEQKIKTIFWSVTNKDYGLKKIMNGMYVLNKDMKNDMQAMNDDLLQKKSFYEVEDVVRITESGFGAITVELVNCDDAIPLEKRAFVVEMLGYRMNDPRDSLFVIRLIFLFRYHFFTGIRVYYLQQGINPISHSDVWDLKIPVGLSGFVLEPYSCSCSVSSISVPLAESHSGISSQRITNEDSETAQVFEESDKDNEIS